MGSRKSKGWNRILAMLLSVMMIFSALPMYMLQTFAATEVYPDVFTFQVMDDANPVVGANVRLYNDTLPEVLEWNQTTDENGEVFFSEYTALGLAGNGVPCNYTITADGYDTVNGTVDGSVLGWTANVPVTMSVTPVEKKQVTITVNKNEGGTVLLNGAEQESIIVEEGSQIELVAKANEGYQVAAVSVGGESFEIPANTTEYPISAVASSDVEISVSFVKVYTVVIKHNADGKVDVTPSGMGGTVTVETEESFELLEGKTIDINAVPDATFRVSGVTINRRADETVTGKNNSGYQKTLVADKEYTVEITFAPNIYNVNINTAVNGIVTAEDITVEHNKGTKVLVSPADGYTVGAVTVNDVSVTNIIKDETGIYFTIEGITEDQNVAVTFKEIAKADRADLIINNAAALRKNAAETYLVIKKGTDIGFSTSKQGLRLYDGQNSLIGGDETTNVISINNTKTVASAQLYYQADGEYYAQWHDVDMDAVAIVADETAPTVTLEAVSKPNQFGYYKKNVGITVEAEDAGDYSGIQKVEYWITFGNVQTDATTIYENTGDKEIVDKIEISDKVVVNARQYNSKDVKVYVVVTDFAGNSNKEKPAVLNLNINSTAPTVTLDITGEHKENALPGYYTERELTITIVDREDTFSEKRVAEGMMVKVDDETLMINERDISWVHNGSAHIGTYKFTEDGKYQWSISYSNKADVDNTEVVAPQDKYIYDFTIDTKAPYDLTVTYEDSVTDMILENITFGFYQASAKVTVEAKDDTAGVEQFSYSYTVSDGVSAVNKGKTDVIIPNADITYKEDKASATFEIPAQFRGKVSFTATDKAGHSAKITDGKEVIVDNIAPGVSVNYTGPEAENGKYYNSSRRATITIEEANFFAADLYDVIPGMEEEYLVIEVGRRLNNEAEYTITKEKPVFEKDGDIYTAEILFEEDADYTFDVKYTDRSGNKYDSYVQDEFVIDTIKPVIEIGFNNNDCLNEKYFKANRMATITVTEHNFDASTFAATVTVDGVKDSKYTEFLTDYDAWTHTGDVHMIEIPFEESVFYTLKEIGCSDLAGNTNDGIDYGKSAAPEDFVIDKESPINLKISYSKAVLDAVLEGVSFGFYQAPAVVTLEADDVTAGIDYVEYTYAVDADAAEINQGKERIEVKNAGTDNKFETTFEIPAQFRGKVSFVAYDKAGNGAEFKDNKVIVVDNIAPGITVKYQGPEVKNELYYDGARKAIITIDEANFFGDEEEYLVIEVGTRLNSETDYTITKERPEFKQDGDVYVAEILFEEDADYTFDIKYTDRSGNVYDTYEKDLFTVDNTDPIVQVTHTNNDAKNEKYFGADRPAEIVITEHNFRASDVVAAVTLSGNTGGSKESETVSTDYTEYLKDDSNWTHSGDVHTTEISFDAEGYYTFDIECTDLAGRKNTEVDYQDSVAPVDFVVDKTTPADLEIAYSKAVLDTILEGISFGFYQAPVEVTIKSTDAISGVDYLTYSYILKDDASDINIGKENITVENAGTDKGMSATFEIPAQFRGYVSFEAVDMAANRADIADDKVIVVDNIAPGVTVRYEGPEVKNENSYDGDRVAIITIDEENFFGSEPWGGADLKEEYLVITVGKRLNDEDEYTYTKEKPEFKQNGDVYEAEIPFEEDADYTFDIKYTDRSGNVYDSYEEDVFTIDKIKPVLQVNYKNNDVRNEKYFNADRTVEIVITEHNFRAVDVTGTITVSENAGGTEESKKIAEEFAAYLKDDSNWTHNGDVHTVNYTFTEEANYTFKIECIDLAGNKNDGVDYGISEAYDAFTIDKTSPTNLEVKINDAVVNDTVEEPVDSLAFDKFYAGTVSVKLFADYNISGMHKMQYQKVDSVSGYDEKGIWTDYDETAGILIEPSERFIIYFRAEDKAENVTIIRSTGIVVDNQQPVGETKAPEIDILPEEANENGIHNGPVKVALKINDPKFSGSHANEAGYYSGLSKITYKIRTTDTDEVVTRDLLDVANGVNANVEGTVSADNLISSWSGEITIDPHTYVGFNSNNVIVEVTAIDNAGNTRISTTTPGQIKIDITAPTIDISYSNNTADSGSFFRSDRTATIVVTERNFNPNDVKVTLTNTDSVIPPVNGWTKTAGTGNQDNTKWTATIHYSADGDYKFGIEYTDLANNPCVGAQYGNSVAPTEFTIDKTVPVVNVSYDNNNAQNGNYYKETRTATIVVTEHNFDSSRVEITLTATDDGADATRPTVSGWSSSGDRHTATIYYGNDSKYTFDIAVTDKAGNASADYAQDEFYVDKTAPTLEITGVVDMSANNGDVIPVVSYSDTNYDVEQVKITLLGVNRKAVELDGSYVDIHNGRMFTFKNFPVLKEVDDIYTLTATLTDKAGNTTTETITFSVNRFGSTYMLGKATEELKDSYVQIPVDVVITETNANELTNIKITLFKNNETLILEEGVDYKVDVTGGNGRWYQYIYTIFKENFMDDGIYRVAIHSEDAAGNVAENTLDTKETEISFGVDKTKPNVVVANLESGTTYALEKLVVAMSVSDNLLLSSVTVYLDDYNKAYKTWSAEEIAQIIAENGEFTFDISGDSTSAHKVKIVCVDAAGNEQVEEITDFFVTTNLWVRYYNNKSLFFGSIAGVILFAGLIVFFVVYKKKEEK